MPLEMNKAESYGCFEESIIHFRSENNVGFIAKMALGCDFKNK